MSESYSDCHEYTRGIERGWVGAVAAFCLRAEGRCHVGGGGQDVRAAAEEGRGTVRSSKDGMPHSGQWPMKLVYFAFSWIASSSASICGKYDSRSPLRRTSVVAQWKPPPR